MDDGYTVLTKLNKNRTPICKPKPQKEEMDSVKMFKGYGKLEVDHHHHIEDQHQKQNPKFSKSHIATISIIAILFLTLTLAFSLLTLIHHTNSESPEHDKVVNSTESIRVVCNVTRFPNSCFSAISSSSYTINPSDPKSILGVSLRVSIHELTKLNDSLSRLNQGSLADCKDQIDDALSRLNDSLSVATATMTDEKITDIQTWVSAAVTDLGTCVDGLEEMGDVAAVSEMNKLMKKSNEYTSNSLAIVANFHTLLQRFHMQLH